MDRYLDIVEDRPATAGDVDGFGGAMVRRHLCFEGTDSWMEGGNLRTQAARRADWSADCNHQLVHDTAVAHIPECSSLGAAASEPHQRYQWVWQMGCLAEVDWGGPYCYQLYCC